MNSACEPYGHLCDDREPSASSPDNGVLLAAALIGYQAGRKSRPPVGEGGAPAAVVNVAGAAGVDKALELRAEALAAVARARYAAQPIRVRGQAAGLAAAADKLIAKQQAARGGQAQPSGQSPQPFKRATGLAAAVDKLIASSGRA